MLSLWQGAFVPRRMIQDNAIIAQNVIGDITKIKWKEGLITLNIDMEKTMTQWNRNSFWKL